jgi:P-type Ca2+ transporter type 2C
MNNWHTLDIVDLLQSLKTHMYQGLEEAEATRRLAEYGPNELTERGSKGPWRILWEQLAATMVIILIVAALLSAALGDYKDMIVILAIVVLNATLGFIQEYRAERALAALKKLAAPIVRVQRSGHVQEISARNLVPGDLVLLAAGNFVPADGRVVESFNLRIQEAALTGESEPVDKDPQRLTAVDLPLGDRHNMAYLGTIVTYGRGQILITATGMATELGAIATLMQTMEQEPTPLQRRLDHLGRILAVVALAIVGVIFVLGLLRGEALQAMFLTAISMAVAAVPEGLPAVVTIALALGAQRMLKRRALIRKLAAVETLGSVTVICSDKTGTLTENRMTVTVLDVANQRIDLSDNLRTCELSTITGDRQSAIMAADSTLALLLAGGALCNDAVFEVTDAGQGDTRVVGDPTEGALIVVARHFGLPKADLNRTFPRIAELPFDAVRKRMTTVHATPITALPQHAALASLWNDALANQQTPYIAFTKGAVDSLLDQSNLVWMNGHTETLDSAWRARIMAANDHLAHEGMRVLGLAFQPLPAAVANGQTEQLERNLIFIGLVGMIDPARTEVREAVATCIRAGIRPVMITGDHPLTAQAIARELGIASDGQILTGLELDRLSTKELQAMVNEVAVYARVSPQHKLKIVEALQNRGHIVAMTGDGVNDAPALRKADIGVAMGITGTDVAKEAASMVLQDDNFATIVAAVAEGRVIYDNIRKFIKFLLSTNSGELWLMLVAPLIGMPLPLLPLQVLWVNLVTDGLPALALGLEPAERATMQRPPYPPSESIFGRRLGWHILWVGLLMGAITLGTGYWYWHNDRAEWQTMVFLTLTLAQMAHVLAIRSEHDSLFRIGLLSNKPLLAAVILTCGLQVAVVYLPFLQGFFSTVTLSAGDLALSIGLSSLVFWAVELEKWLMRPRT